MKLKGKFLGATILAISLFNMPVAAITLNECFEAIKSVDGGNTFSEMLMQVEEPQEYVLIRLVGKVDPENIKNLMKSGSIK